MKQFVCNLIALPLKGIAQIITFLNLADPVPIHSTICRLTQENEDGCKLLSLVAKQSGIEQARQIADEILTDKKHSSFAAVMAVLELAYAQNFHAAASWIEKAKQLNAADQHLLLEIQFDLAPYIQDYDPKILAPQILERKDLPSTATLKASLFTVNQLIEEKKYSDAEKIVDHLLAVQDNPSALLAKWAILWAKNKPELAQKFYRKTQKLMAPEIFNLMIAQYSLEIENTDSAIQHLYLAEQLGIDLEKIGPHLTRLKNSTQYQLYQKEQLI